jgi:hypothetical protein
MVKLGKVMYGLAAAVAVRLLAEPPVLVVVEYLQAAAALLRQVNLVVVMIKALQVEQLRALAAAAVLVIPQMEQA